MKDNLGKLNILRKTGNELFHASSQNLEYNLLSFWQWADSDLVSNTLRGRLAEYIVAQALGAVHEQTRIEWDSFDILTQSGIKIEVKSAAYIQSWRQRDYSKIMFLTPKTRFWDVETNIFSHESKRQADIYIFALLAHKDKTTIDPLNVNQWLFYVLPTDILNSRKRSQHSISLRSLEKICQPVKYHELNREVYEKHSKSMSGKTPPILPKLSESKYPGRKNVQKFEFFSSWSS